MKPETLEFIALNIFRIPAVPKKGDFASYEEYEAYFQAMLANTYSVKEAQKRLVLEMADHVPPRRRDYALLYREVLLGCDPEYLLRTLHRIYEEGLDSDEGVNLENEEKIALIRHRSTYAVRTARGETPYPTPESARGTYVRLVKRAVDRRNTKYMEHFFGM